MNVSSSLLEDSSTYKGDIDSPPHELGRPHTILETFLPKVLQTMGWRRSARVFDSALPAESGLKHLDEAAMLLALLEVPANVETGFARYWQDGLDGAILAYSGNDLHACIRVNGRETCLSTKEIGDAEIRKQLGHANELLFVRNVRSSETTALLKQALLSRIRSSLRVGLFLSFFVNAAAVLIPLFTMTIFDRVIGGRAPESLWPLVLGGGIVVFSVLLLRRALARFLAAQHSRLAAVSGASVETRLLRAGFGAMQRQSVERIEARIGSVRRIADLFASSNTSAVFDAPFILLSIAVIAMIGGVLAIVPIVYMLLFVLLALVLARAPSSLDPEIAVASGERQALLLELGAKARDIREAGMATTWLGRFAEVARRSAHGSYRASVRSALLQSLGAILGTGAALTTLIVGVDLALQGSITSGTLVATMLLVWRITGPAQGFFLGLPRIRAAVRAINSLDQSLNIPTLTAPAVALEPAPASGPAIAAKGVFFRYDADMDPAMTGITFAVEPGSVTAVIGPNGAGKTTLLRLLSGALMPQSGQIVINGLNIRQYDPDEIALGSLIVPALTFGHDNGDNGSAGQAPHGWDPRPGLARAMAAAFPGSAGSSLAGEPPDRPLMIFDDPTATANETGKKGFRAFLEKHRGSSTIIFTTHDTSLVQFADNAVVLNEGALVYFGPVSVSAPNMSTQTEEAS